MVELIHGDCLEYLKKLSNKSIDVVVTDPPYGLKHWVAKKKRRGGPIKQRGGGTLECSGEEWGSKKWDDEIPAREYFEQMVRVSKNQIIFGGNYFAHLLPPSPAWLTWDKDNTGNFADFETAWTSYKINFEDLESSWTAILNDREPVAMAWSSYKTAARLFKYRWNGMMQGDIQNKKLNEKRVHPTQKPLPLMEWVIQNYTKKGDTILDPFMGSGTTGIACINLGRSFIGIEKEEQFFPIAKSRIEAADAQVSF